MINTFVHRLFLYFPLFISIAFKLIHRYNKFKTKGSKICTSNNSFVIDIFPKWPFLAVFLVCFFSETVLIIELRFFALHSVHQDPSFELSKSIFQRHFIFSPKGMTLVNLGGVKIYSHSFAWSKIENKKTVLESEGQASHHDTW